MTFLRKGSRKIVVDDEVFYWKIRNKITHNERHGDPIAIPIQHESGRSILLVNLAYCRAGELGGYTANPLSSITPKTIEICIRFGIANGWKYLEKGKQFSIENLTESAELILRITNV